MAERVDLTREESQALRRLRAEFDRASRRSAEVTPIECAPMESEIVSRAVDEETRPQVLTSDPQR